MLRLLSHFLRKSWVFHWWSPIRDCFRPAPTGCGYWVIVRDLSTTTKGWIAGDSVVQARRGDCRVPFSWAQTLPSGFVLAVLRCRKGALPDSRAPGAAWPQLPASAHLRYCASVCVKAAPWAGSNPSNVLACGLNHSRFGR